MGQARPRRAWQNGHMGSKGLPVFALLLALTGPVAGADRFDVTVSPVSVRPGDVLMVTIVAPPGTSGVGVRALHRHWPAARVDDTTWRGIVGIDLDTTPGAYDLVVASSDEPAGVLPHSSVLRVSPRRFPRRVLRVAPEYVQPPPELVARITREAAFLEAVFAASDAAPAWLDGLTRPVEARANSSFGTRSVFNGEPRNPHAGTDFLSSAGTPIRAPAGGRVVAARDLFFSGNTVVIDHGLGVISTLAHLSRLDVREGAPIERGQIVGLVGATGRVTGAHLHWALRVGGARVDPLAALLALAPPSSLAPPP